MSEERLPLWHRLWKPIILRVRPAPLAVALKCFLKLNRVIQRTPHGRMWLDPFSNMGAGIAAGIDVSRVPEVIEAFISNGGIYVDVGANEGFYALLAANRAGPDGRVVMVEPQARLEWVIEENFGLNYLDNWTICRVAIGDKSDEVTLYLSPDLNTGSTSLIPRTRYTLPTEKVRMITLQMLLDEERLPHVDLLKLDIEGYEYEAILGSPEVFKTGRIKQLSLELHHEQLRERGHDPDAITGFLQACGYRELVEWRGSRENGIDRNTVWQFMPG
jgi:FkbM family methyltransferase